MKDLDALIVASASRGKEPEYAELYAFCERAGIPPDSFCNEFALRVAKGFRDGILDYEFCDEAINYLFSFFTTPPLFGSDRNIPQPAFEIYQAFDEGEYRHSKDPTWVNPVEKYTRPQIAEILQRYFAD